MSVEIRVPELGESVVDATVGRWLKKEGEAVTAGEPLVELETDKINFEVEAEQDGVLASVLKEEGETVGIGDVLGTLGEGDGAPRPEAEAEEPEAAEEPVEDGREAAAGGRAAPSVRKLAEEHGVDLSEISGSGPGGRITREDVEQRIGVEEEEKPPAPPAEEDGKRAEPAAEEKPAPQPARDGREERIRMSRRRQTIAKRLVEAQQNAAMLTTFNEVDMSAVMDLRARRKEAFQERHGVRLGFMSFFTKAVIGALKAFPELNAEIQGDEIVLKRYYDIGVAVSTEEGLVVPVVRDADRKDFAQLEREIYELSVKARERRLGLEELQGGTFTITNGGVFGSLLSTPILNAPQVGILGMHKVEERPVVVDGEIVIRPMMYVALSYDHRIVDGREAVSFLVRVKELIEDPEALLLEG
ncbi:2-oxoglutarate dehydrogenase complex dihydrolipoyllysine-residue succinyltransferase [Rubrobacter taiwanensis]|uniref:Dihydrolipoyllysine-residue succinyltransferase component of 2-oxoglutarate dehydrogenase complex n=1 Tax=Rubrobacter taiwanensis TaxID=185139 RepID=A0A4R1BG38_9ACTN|nr:2-oxoglutarate dehydrogenase complex dihydrolipoyllysine-residue succinyltransferase [Rubrobacter taiwanensis]TCJ16176.1 2-oxoglutarate dehydrogenase complex dihydrolipoyllysine-residue succinyltransferase [Rubrobacter taiwanensis]